MGKKLEASLAVLNGTIGDYLARTGNGLATAMTFVPRIGGPALRFDGPSLARALPGASPRVALLIHGLMCTESIWEMADGTDFGVRLAQDLGFTPVYVRYNSGLAIADNGAQLAAALEAFTAAYPVPLEEILLIGHSMGGLVVRAACHSATLGGDTAPRPPPLGASECAWLRLVRRAIYVGTPHLGAPLERMGRVVARVLHAINDPYTQLVGQIADLRSAGMKDLGDAVLRHEDRGSKRGQAPESSGPRLEDARHPVPLLPRIALYLIAGTISTDPWLTTLFGDALVPLASATDGSVLAAEAADAADSTSDVLPPSHVKVFRGISHMVLARDPEVYETIRAWSA
jgi:triacylglycerol lipase